MKIRKRILDLIKRSASDTLFYDRFQSPISLDKLAKALKDKIVTKKDIVLAFKIAVNECIGSPKKFYKSIKRMHDCRRPDTCKCSYCKKQRKTNIKLSL